MTDKKYFAVFTAKSEVPIVRFLRPGFKHCYALIHDGTDWITVDALSHMTEVTVHRALPPGYDLPGWLEAQGHIVVPVDVHEPVAKPLPWGFFTCVESVKRLFGIRRRRIQTPWQLYCYLKKGV